MRRRLAVIAGALAAIAGGDVALADGPESPPPPWFVVLDTPSANPKFNDTRWLWNRDAHALRYCHQDATTGLFTCASDLVMPAGRWVMQRQQAQPEPGVDAAVRFYSPDLDRTLNCRATAAGAFSCR